MQCAHRAVSERSHALVNVAERRASVARQVEVAVLLVLYFLNLNILQISLG